MNKLPVIILFFLFSLLNHSSSATEDMTIYAQDDKSYTYKSVNYTLDKFPIDSVITDYSGGESVIRDSVLPITVEIFPSSQVELQQLRTLIRPLAIKFHRKGVKVNTRFFNKTIPYIFKKKKTS